MRHTLALIALALSIVGTGTAAETKGRILADYDNCKRHIVRVHHSEEARIRLLFHRGLIGNGTACRALETLETDTERRLIAAEESALARLARFND